jgi:hypothetical protein
MLWSSLVYISIGVFLALIAILIIAAGLTKRGQTITFKDTSFGYFLAFISLLILVPALHEMCTQHVPNMVRPMIPVEISSFDLE